MTTHFSLPAEDSSSGDDEGSLFGVGHGDGENRDGVSLLMRSVMRISRARWFAFIRRVFHHQNGMRSELGSDPLNSGVWLALEFVILVAQIVAVTATLTMAKDEKPVWVLRIWALGYNLGSILSIPLLLWRYKHPNNTNNDFDVEQQRGISDETRTSYFMYQCRTGLELFFAVWFVMGNIWVFDVRNDSFRRSPTIHKLCIALLAWNAVGYSLPFILFVLLCCCVPLVNSTLGYNMNVACIHPGATEQQISRLPSWKYKTISVDNSDASDKLSSTHGKHEESECCICLSRYKEKEEVRELPCLHLFHLRCVDQWLRIISSCPLCKRSLRD